MAKEVVSNSSGLDDLAIGLVNSVLNLPDLGNSMNPAYQKTFFQAS